MTFIDPTNYFCGRYEGFFLKSQFWPIVRRIVTLGVQCAGGLFRLLRNEVYFFVGAKNFICDK